MNSTRETRLAEAADRRWNLLVTGMFLLGLKSAVSAAMVVTGEPYLRYLDWAELALAIPAVVIMLWVVFLKFARVPREQRRRFLNMEGFVKETIQLASLKTMGITFLTLTVFVIVSRKWFVTVPAEFFLEASIAVMLMAFSAIFFVQNMHSEDEDMVSG